MTCFIAYWNPLLTLLVSMATLVVVIRYTIITASIERAAQQQAEASQKPVVVLKSVLREDSDDEILESISQKRIVQGSQLAVTGYGHFILRNIGTGPALNLSFDFVQVGSEPDDPGPHARNFPYFLPNSDLESPFSGSTVTEDYRFTARYESLSGKKYQTEMILHPRSGLTVVLRDDWIFKTLDPPGLFKRISQRQNKSNP